MRERKKMMWSFSSKRVTAVCHLWLQKTAPKQNLPEVNKLNKNNIKRVIKMNVIYKRLLAAAVVVVTVVVEKTLTCRRWKRYRERWLCRQRIWRRWRLWCGQRSRYRFPQRQQRTICSDPSDTRTRSPISHWTWIELAERPRIYLVLQQQQQLLLLLLLVQFTTIITDPSNTQTTTNYRYLFISVSVRTGFRSFQFTCRIKLAACRPHQYRTVGHFVP